MQHNNILGEYNYTRWAVCMKNYLIGEGIWQIVDGSEPEPSPKGSSPESIRKWRKENAKALHAIQASCGSIMFSYISMDTSAKAAWDRLASINCKVVPHLEFLPLDNQGSCNNTIPYMFLYHAVVNGNKRNLEKFLERFPDVVSAQISTDGGTALHTAALHRHDDLVKLLVDEAMPSNDLELRTTRGATALHIAATGKSVDMAKTMVNKNNNLLRLKDADGYIPLCIAALYGDKHMLRYLYSVTSEEDLNPETSNSGATLLSILISVENYSFALNLLERYPKLAITKDVKGRICLNVLARKRSSFPSGSQLSTWQRWIYALTNFNAEGGTNYPSDRCIDIDIDPADHSHESRCSAFITNLALRRKKGILQAAYELLGFNKISQLKLKHCQAMEILIRICKQLATLNSTQHWHSLVMPSMFHATECGNVDFVAEMIKFDPALVWSRTDLGGIFHAAVAQREENICNLIYETQERRYHAPVEDEFDNNILHMAGMLAPVSYLSKIPGPAMQMQRELKWFKAVEEIVQPIWREQRNSDGKTPRTLFSEKHKDLANEGAKWMKDTATSCLVVATLIATVMFEGAIQIPGGSNAEGNPYLESAYYFQIYVISDAVSFAFAAISIIMFLSILTSRYAEEDFLDYLPMRLTIGLFTIFFSIATMMSTFGCSIYINLVTTTYSSVYSFLFLLIIPATLFASLFAYLHFPLLIELTKSLRGPPIFNPRYHRKLLGSKSVVPQLANINVSIREFI